MTEPEGVPELQGPPEVLEAIDRFLADPSTGVRAGRPQRRVMTDPREDEIVGDPWPKYQVGHQTFFPAEEQAELEKHPSEEEQYKSPHWLLITGVGLVVIGILIRWLMRRR